MTGLLSTTDQAEANRLTTLVWRIEHGHRYRISGVIAGVAACAGLLFLAGFLLGVRDFKIWMIPAATPFLIIAGGCGEAIGRMFEERNASEEEIILARFLLWEQWGQGRGSLERWLVENPSFTRPWLRRLAEFSPDASIAVIAGRLLRSEGS